MNSIKQTYLINAPIEKVWEALTNTAVIEKWGAGPAEMDDKVGTNFKLWGGEIYGKNIEVVPNKLLKQEWYAGKWDKPSILTFTLSESDGKTKISLVNQNVPEDEFKDVSQGWKDFYMNPLKKLLEEN